MHCTCVITSWHTASRLLQFGPDAGDDEVETVSDLTGERVSPLLTVPDGVPLYEGTVASAVYVSCMLKFSSDSLCPVAGWYYM